MQPITNAELLDHEREMAADYGTTTAPMRRISFSKEQLASAKTFIIGEDGVRREHNLDILSLAEEFTQLPTRDFANVIEALKMAATKRGAEDIRLILAHCEHELL